MSGSRPLPPPAAVALSVVTLSACEGRLAEPRALWLLWVVPLLGVFLAFAYRRRERLLRLFSRAAPGGLASPGRRRRWILRRLLELLAVTLLVLSLAGFQYGFTWEEVTRRGVDIVVALDVSDSMLVRDIEGGGLSRLERARREVADLLRLLEGDRIGLVAFAGEAFLECPLTLDHRAAALFLDELRPDLIPVKGTSLSRALETALDAFEGGANESRAIILITDGEDHQGGVEAATERAVEAGVRVFAIGIGRDEGAPIPDPAGGFRRDSDGEIVLSRLDEATLQRLALETGGRYVRSVTGDVDLEQIYLQGIKSTLADQELGAVRRQRWRDRFQWLLGVALVCLMVEPLLAGSARRRVSAS